MPIFKSSILVAVGLFFLLAGSASAAVVYILPGQGNFSRGETVSLDIKINSEGEGINAAQGKISWPAGILEFIEADKAASAFNFWLEEPTASGNSLSFICGTAKGISGEALQILRIKFKTLAAGAAEVSLAEAAVTASDGKGTNVLSLVKGASYRVEPTTVQPELPAESPQATTTPAAAAPPPKPTAAPVIQPVRVERTAVLARGLPQKPEIQVPLYSDEKPWHNYLGEAVVFWQVPPDITEVAAALDHSPNTIPSPAEKELTTGRNFGILADGVWYAHARFKNNIGWGPAAHFRFAIDTKPPLSFELSVLEGETTDNPAPQIQFKSSDALSGLKEYEIKVDGNQAVKISVAEFTGTLTLPLQVPGVHKIAVRAIDQAENSVEDGVTIEIIPIPSPVITFVTGELFSQEGQGLNIKGTAWPNINILLNLKQALKRGGGEVVAKQAVQTDDRGNWEFTFDNQLRNGRYIVTAQSQDGRGALSLTVESSVVLAKSQPIIKIGKFQLGMGGALIFLLIVIVGGFGGGVWFYKRRREKISLRVRFAAAEITKIFKLIAEDTEKLAAAIKTPTTGDDEYSLKRLQENIKRMEEYLKKGIEKIKK